MTAASLMDRMSLPDGFGYILLVVALALALAPWFHGHDFGVVKIPKFSPRMRQSLIVIGPLALLVAIALHVPTTWGMEPAPLPEPEDGWISTTWSLVTGYFSD